MLLSSVGLQSDWRDIQTQSAQTREAVMSYNSPSKVSLGTMEEERVVDIKVKEEYIEEETKPKVEPEPEKEKKPEDLKMYEIISDQLATIIAQNAQIIKDNDVMKSDLEQVKQEVFVVSNHFACSFQSFNALHFPESKPQPKEHGEAGSCSWV